MNKKGQLSLGGVVLLAFVLILGAIFIGAIANETSPLTTTQSETNDTVTFPNNGSTLTLNGQALVGSLVAHNTTDGAVIPATNYTTTDLVQVGGEYRLVLTNNDEAWNGLDVNLSYTYEPVGYNRDSGARGVAPLPLLFFAFALFAAAAFGVREWINQK